MEDRRLLEQKLKSMLMVSSDNPEMVKDMQKMIDKMKDLKFEYRNGRLYVGSGSVPKWEVITSKTGNVYCKCPHYAFHERPGRGTGFCKHTLFAMAMDLEIPAVALTPS